MACLRSVSSLLLASYGLIAQTIVVGAAQGVHVLHPAMHGADAPNSRRVGSTYTVVLISVHRDRETERGHSRNEGKSCGRGSRAAFSGDGRGCP